MTIQTGGNEVRGEAQSQKEEITGKREREREKERERERERDREREREKEREREIGGERLSSRRD